MMLTSEVLTVSFVTTHIGFADVSEKITPEIISISREGVNDKDERVRQNAFRSLARLAQGVPEKVNKQVNIFFI